MPKFVVKKDAKGHFRFNLVANNGEIIATSESYKAKPAALKTIASIQKGAATAKIVDTTEPAKPAAKAAAKTPAKKVAAKKATAKKPAAKAAPAPKKPAAKKAAVKKPAPAPAPAETPAPATAPAPATDTTT